MVTKRGGVLHDIIKCDNYLAWWDWKRARWHLLWCMLSARMLLTVRRQSEGLEAGTVASSMMYAIRAYASHCSAAKWRTGSGHGSIFYDVCYPRVCFSLFGGKVKGGFNMSQVLIVNRLLHHFIDDWLQFTVLNDFVYLNLFPENIVRYHTNIYKYFMIIDTYRHRGERQYRQWFRDYRNNWISIYSLPRRYQPSVLRLVDIINIISNTSNL